MTCPRCASTRVVEFSCEMMLNFTGLANMGRPGVLMFPKASVCLDCGFLHCLVAPRELARLQDDYKRDAERRAFGFLAGR
jgi:hypothetical protein